MNHWTIVLLFIAYLTTYLSLQSLGDRYDPQKKPLDDVVLNFLNRNDVKFDSVYIFVKDFILCVLFVLLITRESSKVETFLVVFAIVLIIRSLMMYVTVLPDSTERCDPEKNMSMNYTGLFEDRGTCGDLSVSGHTAFAWIILLCFLHRWKKNSTRPEFFLIIALVFIEITCILLSRSHYTSDVLNGILLSTFVFQSTSLYKRGELFTIFLSRG